MWRRRVWKLRCGRAVRAGVSRTTTPGSRASDARNRAVDRAARARRVVRWPSARASAQQISSHPDRARRLDPPRRSHSTGSRSCHSHAAPLIRRPRQREAGRAPVDTDGCRGSRKENHQGLGNAPVDRMRCFRPSMRDWRRWRRSAALPRWRPPSTSFPSARRGSSVIARCARCPGSRPCGNSWSKSSGNSSDPDRAFEPATFALARREVQLDAFMTRCVPPRDESTANGQSSATIPG